MKARLWMILIFSLLLSSYAAPDALPIGGAAWRSGGSLLFEPSEQLVIKSKVLSVKFMKEGARVRARYTLFNKGPRRTLAFGLPLFFNFNDTGLKSFSNSLQAYHYRIKINNRPHPFKPVMMISAQAKYLMQHKKTSSQDALEIKEGQLRLLRSEILFKPGEKKILEISYIQPYCYVNLQTETGKIILGDRQFFYLFHDGEFIPKIAINRLKISLDFKSLASSIQIKISPNNSFESQGKLFTRTQNNFQPENNDNLEVFLKF